MPTCTVLKESVVAGNVSRFEVIFEADDGYKEQQSYQCTEADLKDALSHFNDSHLVADTVIEEAPRVITVKASKEAAAALKLHGKVLV